MIKSVHTYLEIYSLIKWSLITNIQYIYIVHI